MNGVKSRLEDCLSIEIFPGTVKSQSLLHIVKSKLRGIVSVKSRFKFLRHLLLSHLVPQELLHTTFVVHRQRTGG